MVVFVFSVFHSRMFGHNMLFVVLYSSSSSNSRTVEVLEVVAVVVVVVEVVHVVILQTDASAYTCW